LQLRTDADPLVHRLKLPKQNRCDEWPVHARSRRLNFRVPSKLLRCPGRRICYMEIHSHPVIRLGRRWESGSAFSRELTNLSKRTRPQPTVTDSCYLVDLAIFFEAEQKLGIATVVAGFMDASRQQGLHLFVEGGFVALAVCCEQVCAPNGVTRSRRKPLAVFAVEEVAHHSSASFVRFFLRLAFFRIHGPLRCGIGLFGNAAGGTVVGKARFVGHQFEFF